MRKGLITAKNAKAAKVRQEFSLANLRALGGLRGRNRVSQQELASCCCERETLTAKSAKHAKLRKGFSLANLRALDGLGGRNRVSQPVLATGYNTTSVTACLPLMGEFPAWSER